MKRWRAAVPRFAHDDEANAERMPPGDATAVDVSAWLATPAR